MEKTVGVLLFLAGATVLFGILTAEILYPTTYSIAQGMISSLAATPPPHSIVSQPSASIFDDSLILSGVLVLIAAYSIKKIPQAKNFTMFLTLMGIGTMGVGLFPAFHTIMHPVSTLIAFLGGGIAALLLSKLVKPPFSTISILLGLFNLLFLFLGIVMPDVVVPIFGRGGTERFIVYPLILWLCGLGGYLMGGGLFATSKK